MTTASTLYYMHEKPRARRQAVQCLKYEKKINTVHSIIACYQRHCIEASSMERIFAFIFQLSGWALVAPSCLGHDLANSKRKVLCTK